MDNICSNCCAVFERKPHRKGYYRYSLEKTLPNSDKVANDILCSMTGTENQLPHVSKRKGKFMCPDCWQYMCGAVKYRHNVENFWSRTQPESYVGQKRKIREDDPSISKVPRFDTSTCTQVSSTDSASESPPNIHVKVAAKPRKTLFACTPTKAAKWDTIVCAVRQRKYGKAIRGLFHATKGSKKHYLKFLKETIRREVSSVITADTVLSMDANVPNIGLLDWNAVIAQLKTQAPVLEAVLRSAITTKKNEESLKRGTSVNLLPTLGVAAATLLHGRAPVKINFFQTLLSIQFLTGGLKREIIKQLSRTGLCLSYGHSLNVLDKIRNGFDKAAMASKEGVETTTSETQTSETHENADEELEQSLAIAMAVPSIGGEANLSSDTEDGADEQVDDDEGSDIGDDTTDEEDDVE